MFVLGFQAIRVFTTHNFWVFGETSDRIVLALVVVAIFAAWRLAGPLVLLLGLRRSRLLAVFLLAATALVGQISASPNYDLILGAVGTVAFGWVLGLSLAALHRWAALGLAVAFALDVAIRAVFITVDAPFSSSLWATVMVFFLVGTMLLGAYVSTREDLTFPGLVKSLPLLGFGPVLVLFFAFAGNFGQAAAPDAVDLRATMIWVGLGASGGVLWSNIWLSCGSHQARRLHVLSAVVTLCGGSALATLVPAAHVVGTTMLGLGLPVVAGTLFLSDPKRLSRIWSVSVVTISGLLFVILLFVFLSFYGPSWILPTAVAMTTIPALASLLARHPSQSELPSTAVKHSVLRPAVVVAVGFLFLPSLLVGITSPTPSAGLDLAKAHPETLRLLTYNIRQGFGSSNRFDLEAVAQEIERHPADVIALQEIGRGWVISGSIDTLAWLSRRLDMPVIYGSNAGDLWGNAVLTRLPVISAVNTHFDLAGRVPRGFQDLTLQTATAPVRILNTHLDHEDDGDTARAAQILHILESWDDAPRTILLGDLNATPGSVVVRTLVKAGFDDSAPGGPPTDPAVEPVNRIDYIFVTPDLRVIQSRTGESYASDHRLVWTEMTGQT